MGLEANAGDFISRTDTVFATPSSEGGDPAPVSTFLVDVDVFGFWR